MVALCTISPFSFSFANHPRPGPFLQLPDDPDHKFQALPHDVQLTSAVTLDVLKPGLGPFPAQDLVTGDGLHNQIVDSLFGYLDP